MHRVFALFILRLTTHSVAHAQDATEPTPPEVVELILRADTEFDVDLRVAVRTVREAQQIAAYPELPRVARIARRYRLRPGVALRLDASQLQQVIDHNGAGTLFHALGHVVGILGAILGGGAVVMALLTASLLSAFRSSGPENGLVVAVSMVGVGGALLAAIGVALHDVGSENDEEAKLLLRVVPAADGASLLLSARF